MKAFRTEFLLNKKMMRGVVIALAVCVLCLAFAAVGEAKNMKAMAKKSTMTVDTSVGTEIQRSFAGISYTGIKFGTGVTVYWVTGQGPSATTKPYFNYALSVTLGTYASGSTFIYSPGTATAYVPTGGDPSGYQLSFGYEAVSQNIGGLTPICADANEGNGNCGEYNIAIKDHISATTMVVDTSIPESATG